MGFAVIFLDAHQIGADLGNDAAILGDDHIAGVNRGAFLDAGAHQRSLGFQQRHCLTLHVSPHQGAVRIVVFQERDHRGRDRHHLTSRNVHQVDFFGADQHRVATGRTAQHRGFYEVPVFRELRGSLGDVLAFFVVSGDVVDFVGDDAFLNHAIGGFHKTVRVNPRESRQRTNQTNVRAFGSFHRAHAPVVRGVHVTNFHPRPVTGQAARTQSGQTALVRQTRQRVVLVHELRQLRGPKELFDGRHDRANVNERVRGDGFDVLSGHAFLHRALHTGHTRAHLHLNELADRTHPAVAEVVDVVGLDAQFGFFAGRVFDLDRVVPGTQRQQVAEGGDNVGQIQGALAHLPLNTELLVDFVASHLG